MHKHSPLPRFENDSDSSDHDDDPYDRMESRFTWQWDRMVGLTLSRGAQGNMRNLLKHLLWACVQWLLIIAATVAVSWHFGDRWFWDLLMRNAFLFHFFMEFIGCTGMYSGFQPLFPFTWYRFTCGTLKEPLFRFLGDRRSLTDILISVANVVVPLLLMLAPPASSAVVLFAPCVIALLVTDLSGYIGAMGCYYGPISLIFACKVLTRDVGHIAALQILLITIYISCGISKIGPWFSRVTMLEWTQPAVFAGKLFWQRLFFENVAAHKWSPTWFAKLLAHLTATVECVAPLLFFCTPSMLACVGLGWCGTTLINSALLIMCSMHAYIVFHMGSDVNMLNTVTALWCVYVFRIRSVGFDYEGLAAMNLGIRCLIILFILFVIFGHCSPDVVCCQTCYRFWAGNWPQAFYVFSEKGLEKLKNVPANVKLPTPTAAWSLSAFIWASQGPARILPSLLLEVGKKRPQLTMLVPAFIVANYCLGSSSNCSIRATHLNPRLHRICEFVEGEAIYIFCGGFAGLSACISASMQWYILDLGKGLIAQGKFSCAEVSAISKPSDCQLLSKRFPLLPAS